MSDDPDETRRRMHEALNREEQQAKRRLYKRLAMWVLILAAIIASVGTVRSWW